MTGDSRELIRFCLGGIGQFYGEDELRVIGRATQKRIGEGGTTRQWLMTLFEEAVARHPEDRAALGPIFAALGAE